MSAFDRFYLRPATADRVRAGWLGTPIEHLVEALAQRGYSVTSVRRSIREAIAFGEFARAQGAVETADLPRHVEGFVAERLRNRRREPARARATFACQVRAPVEALLRMSLPDYQDSRARRMQGRPFESAAPRFFDHLQLERGCRPATIRQYVYHLRAFEDFLRRPGQHPCRTSRRSA